MVKNNQAFEFMNQSRNWIGARKGSELFRLASKTFQSLFHIDTGFFIYKRRGIVFQTESEPVKVFEPWGIQNLAYSQIESFIEALCNGFVDM